MRKILILCVAALFGFPLAAQAETHLIPEDSIYSPMMDYQPGYMRLEMQVFAPAFTDDVRARVIVEPSFSEEFAVGVREQDGTYKLFYYAAPQHLWDYSVLELMKRGEITSSKDGKSITADEIAKLQSSLPVDPSSIKLTQCEIPVQPQLAQSLIGVWRTLLLQTHYDENAQLGVDGDTYHFSMRNGYQDLSGKVWSPPDATDIGMLIAIVYSVKKACGTTDSRLFNDLQKNIIDLSSHISASQRTEPQR
ncbi:MAG: hypothetical protein ABSC92_02920 [Rhizomicrobium sp.]|jgi:hypothetical protein